MHSTVIESWEKTKHIQISMLTEKFFILLKHVFGHNNTISGLGTFFSLTVEKLDQYFFSLRYF